STSPAKVRNTGRMASSSRLSGTTMSRIGCACPLTAFQTPSGPNSRRAAEAPQAARRGVFAGRVRGQRRAPPCRTVADVTARPPHSLHAYFLLGGDPKVPIIYEVDRIRDGRSFTTRNVKASH